MAPELRNSADLHRDPILAAAVGRLRSSARNAGLFFDFDGVLAPIVPDPESALPTEGVIAELDALRNLVGRIAIVSSRNAQFLYGKLQSLKGIEIYGLYGLERAAPDGTVIVEPAAQEWVSTMQSLRSAAAEELPEIYVEDKKLSVALHYRQAPRAASRVEEWAHDAAKRLGLKLQPGRMAIELKPPVSIDKGSVVARLVEGLQAAWYFGDDLGDLPAFAAVHRRAMSDPDFSGIVVGIDNDTLVEDVRAQCDVFLGSPVLLVELLAYLRTELAGR